MKKIIKQKTYFYIMAGVVLILLQSCQHKPVKKEAPQKIFKSAKVKSKVQIKNLKSNRVDYVTVDALVDSNQSMRQEIRGAFGVLAAVLVFRNTEFEFWIPLKNKAGRGQANSESVRKALGIPLDPQIFYVVLADADFRDRNWLCKNDEFGFKLECENSSLNAKLKWVERESMKRKILISSPQAEINWIIDQIEEVKGFKPSDFQIKWTEDTKVEQF